MLVTGFEISTQKTLVRLPEDVLSSRLTDASQPFWMDVQDPTADALGRLLGDLSLHPLALETCIEPPGGARLEPFPGCLVAQLPLQAAWEDPAVSVLSVICVPATIITIHQQPVRAIEDLVRDFTGDMRLQSASTSAILYQIVDHLVGEGIGFEVRARRVIDELEERFEEDDEDFIKDLLTARRALSRLAVTLEEQHRCAAALQAVESRHFSIQGLQEYLRDTVAHSEYGLRSVTRLQARLREIRQLYQIILHDKADNRLRLLTIISAVFLPLMLVTGIYGMNFRHMPELGWRYAYPAVLALMVTAAVGMLWLFRRRGWFE